MKTNKNNNSSKANKANNSSSANSAKENSNNSSKKQVIAASEKLIAYGNDRKQRIADRYTSACNYEFTKATTANIVNNIAVGNKYAAITIDTLCNQYIAYIKELKNELPKDIIGLLKKYGCETIKQQINDTNIVAFIDNKANVNLQSLVRLVCKYNKDIADVIKNIRTQAKATQNKEK